MEFLNFVFIWGKLLLYFYRTIFFINNFSLFKVKIDGRFIKMLSSFEDTLLLGWKSLLKIQILSLNLYYNGLLSFWVPKFIFDKSLLRNHKILLKGKRSHSSWLHIDSIKKKDNIHEFQWSNFQFFI